MRGGYTANPIASKNLTLSTPCLSIDKGGMSLRPLQKDRCCVQ
jgi:hypothetical protein